MIYLTYTIGFLMVAFTGYLILKYNAEFKAVKVRTRKYIRYMRKTDRKR
jgi:hypothetical protein